MKKITIIILLAGFFSGCASVPIRETLTAYHLNGTTYYSLRSLCQARNISLEYDTFTRSAVLLRDGHKISLMAGNKMILVDGSPLHLNYPVDIYAGTLVIPSVFKSQVIDSLFKERYPARGRDLRASGIKRVVVDAGHGGKDPGAIGKSGLREKDVNLDIARRISNALRAMGLDVVMTRSSDKFIPLGKRVEIANESGADIFLSVHSNANRSRRISGFEVYYVSPTVNDSRRALEAARRMRPDLKNAQFAGSSLNLKAIVWDLIYTSSRAESIELSRAICRAMDTNSETYIIGVKGARYEVLRGARMPAVLVEAGFLSNPSEERLLRSSVYRQKIAEALVEGLSDYAAKAKLTEVAQR